MSVPLEVGPRPSYPKRRQILAAAVGVFNKRGYAGTSLDDLLDATGLDSFSFATHFAGKECCYRAAYDFLLAYAHARVQPAVRSDRTWPRRLASGLAAIFALVEEEPAAARFVLGAAYDGPASIRARTFGAAVGVDAFMRQGRQLAEDSGQIPTVIDSVLPGAIALVVRGRLLTNPPRPLWPLYEAILRLLLLPYLGEAATAEFMTTDAPGFRRSKLNREVMTAGSDVSSVSIVRRS